MGLYKKRKRAALKEKTKFRKKTPKPLPTLPTELWSLITSFVCIEDKFSISLVNCRLHDAVRSPVAWTDVTWMTWVEGTCDYRPCYMTFYSVHDVENNHFQVVLKEREAEMNSFNCRFLNRQRMMIAASFFSYLVTNVRNIFISTQETTNRNKFSRDCLSVFIENDALPRLTTLWIHRFDDKTGGQLKHLLRSARPITVVEFNYFRGALEATDTAWCFRGVTTLRFNNIHPDCAIDIDNRSLQHIDIGQGDHLPSFVYQQLSLKKLKLSLRAISTELFESLTTFIGTPMHGTVELISVSVRHFVNLWHAAIRLFCAFKMLTDVRVHNSDDIQMSHDDYENGVVDVFQAMIARLSSTNKTVSASVRLAYAGVDCTQPLYPWEIERAENIRNKLLPSLQRTVGQSLTATMQVSSAWEHERSLIRYTVKDGDLTYARCEWSFADGIVED